MIEVKKPAQENRFDYLLVESTAAIEARLIYEYGDRQQELVFIGKDLDQEHVTRVLKNCLLTDEEYQPGPGSWMHLEDPMPPIELEEDDDSEG